jgi:hypothetical protein
MATTDKSTNPQNSKEQKDMSGNSQTLALEKSCGNTLEGIAGLVRGKLYYVEDNTPLSYWSKSGEKHYVTVQLVELEKLNANQSRDADPKEWNYICYDVDGGTSSIYRRRVKAKDLLDKDFIDGELFSCLS